MKTPESCKKIFNRMWSLVNVVFLHASFSGRGRKIRKNKHSCLYILNECSYERTIIFNFLQNSHRLSAQFYSTTAICSRGSRSSFDMEYNSIRPFLLVISKNSVVDQKEKEQFEAGKIFHITFISNCKILFLF